MRGERYDTTKSRLRLDPVRAPVVAQIFAWRVTEQLGYRTIASRLNADPGRYPPSIPTRPQAAKGVWCASTVSDILHNPKYTGYWERPGLVGECPTAPAGQ